MPFIALKNLKGFRFWADERKRTGFEANAEAFTDNLVTEFTVRCQEYQEQKEAAKDKDASKPDGFKKLINWALWNESFQNYLRQILSAAKIPLIYLTRDDIEAPGDVLLDQADFGSHTKYLIEATTLEGRHYELDNPQFYRELKSFVVFADSLANGRSKLSSPNEKRMPGGKAASSVIRNQLTS
jgi:hypothetical protein